MWYVIKLTKYQHIAKPVFGIFGFRPFDFYTMVNVQRSTWSPVLAFVLIKKQFVDMTVMT